MGCAIQIADRILVLDQGQVLEHASVQDILCSEKPLIRDFLSEVPRSQKNTSTACLSAQSGSTSASRSTP
jgi:ABC-type methionine transport system ATPase subunit